MFKHQGLTTALEGTKSLLLRSDQFEAASFRSYGYGDTANSR